MQPILWNSVSTVSELAGVGCSTSSLADASDGAGYPQYGHYGYSPYSQYPSYPNTPSIRSAAGYNAQSDPFNFEEMTEAVNQPKHSTQADAGASLQDRRKKSWYGPRQ